MPSLDPKYIATLVAYAVITAILNLIFSKRSQIDEWCEANPKLAAAIKLLRGLGIDPWTIFQSVALAFTKRLPDYQKQSLVELKAKKSPSVPPLGILFALTCFASGFATSCALFGSSSPLWPVVEHCAPSPADLVSRALAILLAGGDIESELLHLAQTASKDAVTCAVKEATSRLSSRVGATPERLTASARGRAFLAKTGNQ